jgi:hypothetical protein
VTYSELPPSLNYFGVDFTDKIHDSAPPLTVPNTLSAFPNKTCVLAGFLQTRKA